MSKDLKTKVRVHKEPPDLDEDDIIPDPVKDSKQPTRDEILAFVAETVKTDTKK